MPRPASADSVILPSGRSVTVNYVEAPVAPAVDSETHPHVCGSCSSQFVQPIEWQRVGAAYWQIELRCPECEWSGCGVFGDDAVACFVEELEQGTDALLTDLSQLSAANMHDHIERFVTALHADQIVAEDF